LILRAAAWVAVASLLACQPPTEEGCEGARFLTSGQADSVLAPVGARRFVRFGLNVEIWYPAEPGSAEGKTAKRYDLRDYLPAEERSKISDAQNAWQECPCFDDLPIDAERGPYPVILFIHGTAAFSHQSAQITAHWASQGFVVIAMDHSGIFLTDMLAMNIAPRQADDARELLAELRAFERGFADLKGLIDLDRIAIAGHSAGGFALAELGDEAGVEMLMPMTAAGTAGPAAKVFSLIMAAVDDQVVAWSQAEEGYAQTPGEKMLLGLNNAGHLAYSDICAIGRARGGLIALLQETGVTLPAGADETLMRLGTDGCALDQMTPQRGWTIINDLSTSHLKARLQCRGQGRTAAQMRATYGDEVTLNAP